MTIAQEGWSLALPLSRLLLLVRGPLSKVSCPPLSPHTSQRSTEQSGQTVGRFRGLMGRILCGLPPSLLGSLVPQSLLGWIRTSCSLWGRPLSQPTASSRFLSASLHLNSGSLASFLSLCPLPTPHISCPLLSACSPSLALCCILPSDPLYSPGPQVELVKWGLPPSLDTLPAK